MRRDKVHNDPELCRQVLEMLGGPAGARQHIEGHDGREGEAGVREDIGWSEVSMSDLFPCPFDGGEAIPDRELRYGCQDGDPDAWAYYIRCRTCAAEGPWKKTPSGADRAWNMRVGNPAVQRIWDIMQGAEDSAGKLESVFMVLRGVLP